MTNTLHLRARPDAPIACDMSTADDTPEERLRDCRRLFESALLRRERHTNRVSFWFRAAPGIHEALEALARREAACCPFLDYRVDTAGDELVWTTTNVLTGEQRAEFDVFLDALYALPDPNSGDEALKPLNVR